MPVKSRCQVQDLLEQAVLKLADISDSPRLDAEVLLARVLEKPRSYLYTWPEKQVEEPARSQFQQVLDRRLQGEPVAHIIGEREFWSINLKVTADTLIPRPETELLVELALERIPPHARWKILDLGTGSGAIAIAIAKECPTCSIIAVEHSDAALQVARENASNHSIANLQFFSGNWFVPVLGKQFHLIVSNPPYIASDDPHLKQGDVRFEPTSALVSGQEGYDDIEHIIRLAPDYLLPGGSLLLEHGNEQAARVSQLMEKYGFTDVSIYQDLAGNDRVCTGRLPE